MKICSKCKKEKTFKDFTKNKRIKDGFHFYCTPCKRTSEKLSHRRNRAKRLAEFKEYRLGTLDKEKARNDEWRLTNPKRKKETSRKYRINNKSKFTAWAAKRWAQKLKATPSWLTKEHLKEIETIYTKCKELQKYSEEPLQVDHIIPLQGDIVSGLHVPWNLQILTRSQNIRKSNKLILD